MYRISLSNHPVFILPLLIFAVLLSTHCPTTNIITPNPKPNSPPSINNHQQQEQPTKSRRSALLTPRCLQLTDLDDDADQGDAPVVVNPSSHTNPLAPQTLVQTVIQPLSTNQTPNTNTPKPNAAAAASASASFDLGLLHLHFPQPPQSAHSNVYDYIRFNCFNASGDHTDHNDRHAYAHRTLPGTTRSLYSCRSSHFSCPPSAAAAAAFAGDSPPSPRVASPYRTHSHLGFCSPRLARRPRHFHDAVATATTTQYVPLPRALSISEVLVGERVQHCPDAAVPLLLRCAIEQRPPLSLSALPEPPELRRRRMLDERDGFMRAMCGREQDGVADVAAAAADEAVDETRMAVCSADGDGGADTDRVSARSSLATTVSTAPDAGGDRNQLTVAVEVHAEMRRPVDAAAPAASAAAPPSECAEPTFLRRIAAMNYSSESPNPDWPPTPPPPMASKQPEAAAMLSSAHSSFEPMEQQVLHRIDAYALDRVDPIFGAIRNHIIEYNSSRAGSLEEEAAAAAAVVPSSPPCKDFADLDEFLHTCSGRASSTPKSSTSGHAQRAATTTLSTRRVSARWAAAAAAAAVGHNDSTASAASLSPKPNDTHPTTTTTRRQAATTAAARLNVSKRRSVERPAAKVAPAAAAIAATNPAASPSRRPAKRNFIAENIARASAAAARTKSNTSVASSTASNRAAPKPPRARVIVPPPAKAVASPKPPANRGPVVASIYTVRAAAATAAETATTTPIDSTDGESSDGQQLAAIQSDVGRLLQTLNTTSPPSLESAESSDERRLVDKSAARKDEEYAEFAEFEAAVAATLTKEYPDERAVGDDDAQASAVVDAMLEEMEAEQADVNVSETDDDDKEEEMVENQMHSTPQSADESGDLATENDRLAAADLAEFEEFVVAAVGATATLATGSDVDAEWTNEAEAAPSHDELAEFVAEAAAKTGDDASSAGEDDALIGVASLGEVASDASSAGKTDEVIAQEILDASDADKEIIASQREHDGGEDTKATDDQFDVANEMEFVDVNEVQDELTDLVDDADAKDTMAASGDAEPEGQIALEDLNASGAENAYVASNVSDEEHATHVKIEILANSADIFAKLVKDEAVSELEVIDATVLESNGSRAKSVDSSDAGDDDRLVQAILDATEEKDNVTNFDATDGSGVSDNAPSTNKSSMNSSDVDDGDDQIVQAVRDATEESNVSTNEAPIIDHIETAAAAPIDSIARLIATPAASVSTDDLANLTIEVAADAAEAETVDALESTDSEERVQDDDDKLRAIVTYVIENGRRIDSIARLLRTPAQATTVSELTRLADFVVAAAEVAAAEHMVSTTDDETTEDDASPTTPRLVGIRRLLATPALESSATELAEIAEFVVAAVDAGMQEEEQNATENCHLNGQLSEDDDDDDGGDHKPAEPAHETVESAMSRCAERLAAMTLSGSVGDIEDAGSEGEPMRSDWNRFLCLVDEEEEKETKDESVEEDVD